MGRNRVMIPFNPHVLKGAIIERGWTLSQVGELFWFQEERIPPRKLADLAQKLELTSDLVAKILDKQESVKDLARENARLRDEIYRLKQAIQALTDLDQPKPAGDER